MLNNLLKLCGVFLKLISDALIKSSKLLMLMPAFGKYLFCTLIENIFMQFKSLQEDVTGGACNKVVKVRNLTEES